MSPQQIDEILERYIKNQCTENEKRLVEEWFDAIGTEERELDIRTQLAIQKRLWSKLDITAHKRYNYWKLSGIAATLLLLVVSSFLFINYFQANEKSTLSSNGRVGMLQFNNPDPAPRRIEMKDGTVIMLLRVVI